MDVREHERKTIQKFVIYVNIHPKLR